MSFAFYRHCSECGHGMWWATEFRCEPCENIVAARVHARELEHAAAVKEHIRQKLEMEGKVEREHPIPQEISDERAEELRKQWEAHHRGRAKHIPILEAKPVDHRNRYERQRDEDDRRRKRDDDDLMNVATALAATSMLDDHCTRSAPPSDPSPFASGASGGGGASESFDHGDSCDPGEGGGGGTD